MFAALLVSLTLAQPVPPVGAGCGPGKPCTATTFTSTAGAFMTKRKASGNSYMCLNNSNGTNGSAWSFYTDPTYTGGVLFGTTPAPTATANACSMPPTSSVFVADNSINAVRWDYHINHATTEYYQNGIAAGSLPTCSSSYQPAINPISDATTMAYCNQVQWDSFATTGTPYSGSTVAMGHPVISTGKNLQTTYAGPRRTESCFVEPEDTADPTCVGFVSAPSKVGVNTGANTADTTISAIGESAVRFNTNAGGAGPAVGDYVAWSKTTGFVTVVAAPRIAWRWRPAATTFTLARFWAGWRGSAATLFGSDSPAGKWCAFRFSTDASDTHFMACSSDGATVSCTDTGVTPSTSETYTHVIEYTAGRTACVFTQFDSTNTLLATTVKTTNLPTLSTDQLYPLWGIETRAVAVRSISFGKMTQEHQ